MIGTIYRYQSTKLKLFSKRRNIAFFKFVGVVVIVLFKFSDKRYFELFLSRHFGKFSQIEGYVTVQKYMNPKTMISSIVCRALATKVSSRVNTDLWLLCVRYLWEQMAMCMHVDQFSLKVFKRVRIIEDIHLQSFKIHYHIDHIESTNTSCQFYFLKLKKASQFWLTTPSKDGTDGLTIS